MTEPNQGETRTINLKGQDIEVRRLRDTQLLLLTREAKVVTRAGADKERVLEAASRLMDVLESAIISPEDKDYFIGLNVRGEVELSDLMQVLTVFSEGPAETKPAVRRGRPRKATV